MVLPLQLPGGYVRFAANEALTTLANLTHPEVALASGCFNQTQRQPYEARRIVDCLI
jgi:hypothetical protein